VLPRGTVREADLTLHGRVWALASGTLLQQAARPAVVSRLSGHARFVTWAACRPSNIIPAMSDKAARRFGTRLTSQRCLRS
jgi:hypothetical protein